MAALGWAVTPWAQGVFSPDVLATGLVSGLASTGLYEAFRNLIGGAK